MTIFMCYECLIHIKEQMSLILKMLFFFCFTTIANKIGLFEYVRMNNIIFENFSVNIFLYRKPMGSTQRADPWLNRLMCNWVRISEKSNDNFILYPFNISTSLNKKGFLKFKKNCVTAITSLISRLHLISYDLVLLVRLI